MVREQNELRTESNNMTFLAHPVPPEIAPSMPYSAHCSTSKRSLVQPSAPPWTPEVAGPKALPTDHLASRSGMALAGTNLQLNESEGRAILQQTSRSPTRTRLVASLSLIETSRACEKKSIEIVFNPMARKGRQPKGGPNGQ